MFVLDGEEKNCETGAAKRNETPRVNGHKKLGSPMHLCKVEKFSLIHLLFLLRSRSTHSTN